MPLLITFAVVLAAILQAASAQVTITPQINEKRGLADWDLDGNGTWKVAGHTLVLEKEGVPGGKIRRPAALAILKSEPLTDLTMKLELRSTAPADLAVRDVQLIVGYQSPSQFYYVHLSAKTDAVHNGIFIVDNADRKRIDTPNPKAYLTDQAWHRIRLERNASTGSIAVFFDDNPTPILSATDQTLRWGRVGVGSFDETGEFRNLEVVGTRQLPTPKPQRPK
jgi:hypothetical protein